LTSLDFKGKKDLKFEDGMGHFRFRMDPAGLPAPTAYGFTFLVTAILRPQ
jgi:hypothetical protein